MNAMHRPIDLLLQRRSVRKYDPSRAIPREDLTALLEDSVLAPSAWNLQPYRLIVIEDPVRKEKLSTFAFHQRQIRECSTAIIVLGDLEAHEQANRTLARCVEHGSLPADTEREWLRAIRGYYAAHPHFARDEAIRNASLLAMQLMLAAQAMGIDSCPMIGFRPQPIIDWLCIPAQFLPVMIISLGYGIQSAYPTYRYPLKQTVMYEAFNPSRGARHR